MSINYVTSNIYDYINTKKGKKVYIKLLLLVTEKEDGRIKE